MDRSAAPLVALAMAAWTGVGAWALVVHGVMDPDRLWAPYLGIVLFGPFWVVGGWAALRLARLARGRGGGADAWRWATVTAAFGWVAAIPFLDALVRAVLGDPFATVNPEGIGLVGATTLVTAAAVATRRAGRADGDRG